MQKKSVRKLPRAEKPEEKKDKERERRFNKPPVELDESDRKSPQTSPVLGMLGKTATLGKDLTGMLSLPANLHAESPWSFSSEKEKSVQALADAFILKAPIPQGLPEYGINISAQGSNSFCTLIDRKRKIIVFESVGNMHVPEGGSWRSFQSSLKEALDEVKRLELTGQVFSLVISNEGILAHF